MDIRTYSTFHVFFCGYNMSASFNPCFEVEVGDFPELDPFASDEEF